MKLLELTVENLPRVPDGAHVFAEATGSARDVVVLEGDAASALLETVAALLEVVRTPAPRHVASWARRRGPKEARLRALGALSGAIGRALLHKAIAENGRNLRAPNVSRGLSQRANRSGLRVSMQCIVKKKDNEGEE